MIVTLKKSWLAFLESELGRVVLSFKQELLVVGVFSFVINLLMLTPTLYMLQVYDRVLLSQSEITLVVLTLVVIFLYAMMASAEWLRTKLLVRVGVLFDQAMHQRIFYASYDDKLKQQSSNSSEIFSDLNHIRQFLTGNGILAFFDVIWTPLYILFCYWLHPILGLASLFFGGILLLLVIQSHRVIRKNSEQVLSEQIEEQTLLSKKLRNPELVESMGFISALHRKWFELHEKILIHADQLSTESNRQISFTKFVRYAQQSLVLAVGAWLVIHDELRPSAMVAANLLVSRGLQPLDMIVSSWREFYLAKLSFRRLDQLLINNPRFVAKTFPMPPAGKFELINFSASAPGRSKPILNNLSLLIRQGDVVAIMGPSGSGKSTLAKCLLGIWPNVEGKLLLDQHSILEYDHQELGPYVGYLPQDVELFEGSVAENIARFGELDSVAVIEAAQKVGIHDLILKFPQGYDTPIGIAGGRLSGGQRQRIGLARAIYGKPSIVVLDEPNANLDDAGEKALNQAILELRKNGATVFIITHTKNILEVTDCLLVLKHGQLLAYGPKQDILPRLIT